jgi:hypothetical protein
VAAVVSPREIHRCLLKLLHVSFLSLTEVSTHHSHTSHAQLWGRVLLHYRPVLSINTLPAPSPLPSGR